MVQILGWFSAEAARASRRNRSSACGSPGYPVGQEFQRDQAVQVRVARLVHDAHAAAA
jgi:hypothetical protein